MKCMVVQVRKQHAPLIALQTVLINDIVCFSRYTARPFAETPKNKQYSLKEPDSMEYCTVSQTKPAITADKTPAHAASELCRIFFVFQFLSIA